MKQSHPCKECLVFVMCQSKLQDAIRDRMSLCDYDEYHRDHKDSVMLAYYSIIAHCDLFQNYIRGIMKILNTTAKTHYLKSEVVIIGELYDAFNIEVSQLINLNKD